MAKKLHFSHKRKYMCCLFIHGFYIPTSSSSQTPWSHNEFPESSKEDRSYEFLKPLCVHLHRGAQPLQASEGTLEEKSTASEVLKGQKPEMSLFIIFVICRVQNRSLDTETPPVGREY